VRVVGETVVLSCLDRDVLIEHGDAVMHFQQDRAYIYPL
jgi:hypothetical protein